METIDLGLQGLHLGALARIARERIPVSLSEETALRIHRTREMVDRWVEEGKTMYGLTTGFGALSDAVISKRDVRKLQVNILMSHAAGVGPEMPIDAVRAVMALRIKDMARGNSGIRMETVDLLVQMLNHDICPVIPEQGSVGASGDLAPLAHLGLVVIGMGEAYCEGRRLTGKAALGKFGLSPIRLEAGEGLALVNGTQVMTAIGGLSLYDAINLTKYADLAAAMSLEVLMGSRTEFDSRIHEVRPHPGQAISAQNMLSITQNSEIITSHKDCHRVQDAYTLRCSPQVHGATKDAINYATGVLETEMNSSTNNPLFFSGSGEYLTGGNFHGQPVALALDFAAIAISEIANISERRVERLVNPQLSGLPAFLVKDGGLNSGFMLAQYTAAALVSENKVLAHPASIDSIPTSANKEDHVSMGTISARKFREIVRNVQNVVAIELLCAAQALDLFTNLKPGEGTLAAYKEIRKAVTHLEADRILHKDIDTVRRLMSGGAILKSVEDRVGPLS